MTILLIVGAAIAIVLLVILRSKIRSLATRTERILAVAAMAVLPLLWLAATLGYADNEMHKVSFCTQCHEMEPYGESLRVDDDEPLAAVHFRNGLVKREKACYTCHTRPGLSGLVEAKLKGVHDVYVHTLGEAPEEIELHGEYDTSICLSCHAEAESFLNGRTHQALLEELLSRETSCLECHDWAHDLGD